MKRCNRKPIEARRRRDPFNWHRFHVPLSEPSSAIDPTTTGSMYQLQAFVSFGSVHSNILRAALKSELLHRTGQDFRNKGFEAWITPQWIKVGIDLDEINFKTSSLACVFFEPVQRLIFFSKREVDHSEAVT